MTQFARVVRPLLLVSLFLGLIIYLAAQLAPDEASALALLPPHAPEDTGGPDIFGYTFRDSDEPNGPVYDWVDISGTGTALGIAGDSRHGPLALGFGFDYYGTSYTDVWVGSDGWIVPGASDPGNNDNSNDCPLPSQNGNENMIGGIWDNLDALFTTPNGEAYYQSFAAGSCPYDGYSGACFVAQWQNTYYSQLPTNPPDDLTFEIILFDNDNILIQMQDVGTRAGSGSTTGIENSNATDGLVYACNSVSSLSNNSAVQFYYPIFAPRFDSSYKTGPALSQPNNNIAYTIVISNSGIVASSGTVLTDTIPAGTTYVPGSVSCVGSGTTTCTYDSGENEIRWVGDVPSDGTVTVSYTVSPTGGSCGDIVANTAVLTDAAAISSPILLPYSTTLADEFTLYNFEADNGGFTGNNDWEYGIPSWPTGLHAHSGDRLWGTVLDGFYNNLNATSTLSRTIDLTSVPDNAQLIWWQYLRTNNSLFDVGTVKLNGNEIYNSAGADELVWTRHTQSLTPYVGGNLNLAFDFFSTLSINSDGWYLDDVGVYYCLPQPVPNLSNSTKTALPIAVTGQTLQYTITLDNFSTVAATNTTLIDPIPTGTTYVAGSATNGAVFNAGLNRIEWTGTVPANGQVDVSFTVTVNAGPGITLNNTATIDQPDLTEPVLVSATTQVVTSQATTYPSCTTFESSLPPYMYTTVTAASGSTGRAVVSNLFPHTGAFGFNLDTNDPSGTGAGTTEQAGTIVANLTGATDVALTFWVRGHADEDDPEDGVFISDDGGQTFAKIYDPPAGTWTPYEEVSLNLSDAAANAGMVFTQAFLIKFQSRDNFAIAAPPLTSDGYSYDDICLEAIAAHTAVTPDTLSSTQLNNVVITQTLTISSLGNDTLNWNFTEAATSCASPSNLPWLSVSPTSGATTPGNNASVTVSFDSTGIPLGTNLSGQLCLNSNDPDDPVITIPVDLVVTSPPAISVSPNPLTATLYTTGTANLSFTITNLGFTEMNWFTLESTEGNSESRGSGTLIYGLDGTTDQLMAFNTDLSAPLFPLAPVDGDYVGADFIPGDILNLYAIKSLTNEFIRISLVDNSLHVISTLTPQTGYTWNGLSADPTTGILYATASNCNDASRLYTIDITTGTPSEIGVINNGSCLGDIAISPSGQLYGVDENNDRLIQINKATAVSTIVGPLGYNAANGQGLDFDDGTGTLYLASLQPGPVSQLRTVNLTTGATTVIGPLTTGSTSHRLGDIAIVPNTNCTPGNITWATINPMGGTVAGDSSVQVSVTFSATGLPVGTHQGSICIFSDDTNLPQVILGLELTVEEVPPPPPPDDLYIFLPLMISN